LTETATPAPSSYVPQAGDVVNARYEGEMHHAIIFRHSGGELVAMSADNSWAAASNIEDAVKVGHSDSAHGKHSLDEGHSIAKAYFAQEKPKAQEQAKAEYKVGELVEVVSNDRYDQFSHCYAINTVARITSIRVDGNVNLSDNGLSQKLHLSEIRPLSGTYAERQAKWVEFHGLKVGDKVKVVRGYKKNEGGFGYPPEKDDIEWVGKEFTVYGLSDDSIDVESSSRGNSFPYFCLEPVR
jgi:transcription antitermination factor NusG